VCKMSTAVDRSSKNVNTISSSLVFAMRSSCGAGGRGHDHDWHNTTTARSLSQRRRPLA